MPEAVLTLNAGSSSIKFSLFEVDARAGLRLTTHGEVESIESAPHFIAKEQSGAMLAEYSWPNTDQPYEMLLKKVLEWIEAHLGEDKLIGVGHRVVHGGSDHYRPARVTKELLAELDQLAPLAPLHQPHNLAAIRAIAAVRPSLPQVACFDTAFHHDMARVVTRFALPREYENAGIRRYGFHGLSYEYIAKQLRETAPDLASGRVIVAHLGNGASLCAMREGRSVDTTMGFTVLDGLVMGTRCGALDPGVILYLERQLGLSPQAVEDLLYRHSGLLGVSGGIASDMRTLLASTDVHATEAIELFVFRIAREIGALASSLDGLDGLVFTAGIGANAPEIRAKICARLAWLGVQLDANANAYNTPLISTSGSKVEIRVIQTDEEIMIAHHVREVLQMPVSDN